MTSHPRWKTGATASHIEIFGQLPKGAIMVGSRCLRKMADDGWLGRGRTQELPHGGFIRRPLTCGSWWLRKASTRLCIGPRTCRHPYA